MGPGGLRYPAKGNFENPEALVKPHPGASEFRAAYLTRSYIEGPKAAQIRDFELEIVPGIHGL